MRELTIWHGTFCKERRNAALQIATAVTLVPPATHQPALLSSSKRREELEKREPRELAGGLEKREQTTEGKQERKSKGKAGATLGWVTPGRSGTLSSVAENHQEVTAQKSRMFHLL